MLANAAIVEAVAAAIAELDLPHVVVDPVMVAKGGDRLLDEEAVEAIRTELLRSAHIVTPNIPEAEVLAGQAIRSLDDMRAAGRRILELGPRVVLVKGGHLDGPESIDVVCTARLETSRSRRPRIDTTSTHGTGCTLSSAIAANLALGLDDRAAIERAREYLDGAIRHAPRYRAWARAAESFLAGILSCYGLRQMPVSRFRVAPEPLDAGVRRDGRFDSRAAVPSPRSSAWSASTTPDARSSGSTTRRTRRWPKSRSSELPKKRASAGRQSRLAIHHRIGRLEIGEASVVIAAASPHRAEAFAACRYAIERIKQIAPIWKHEHFEGGDVWIEGATADPDDDDAHGKQPSSAHARHDPVVCASARAGRQSELSRELPAGATARSAWESLVQEFPALADYGRTVSCAVNEDYARMTTR